MNTIRLRLDLTSEELAQLQSQSFQTFIRYGANYRRIVTAAFMEMGTTDLALRDQPISVTPDEVMAPGEFEKQRRRRYEESFAARTGRYPCSWVPREEWEERGG